MRSKNRFSNRCLHDGLERRWWFSKRQPCTMRSKNRLSNWCLHDGLEGGMMICKNGGHVQMRNKNRFSNRCLHDDLHGWCFVILKMAAIYGREVRIDSQIDLYMMVWRGCYCNSRNGGHVQMRSKNRFSNRCLHDGLQGMVILKMAAMYRWEVRIENGGHLLTTHGCAVCIMGPQMWWSHLL
jgi:hypothetical protein